MKRRSHAHSRDHRDSARRAGHHRRRGSHEKLPPFVPTGTSHLHATRRRGRHHRCPCCTTARFAGCGWPTGRPGRGRRSSSCTATRPRRSCGATSSARSPTTAGASRPTSSAWAPPTRCRTPGPDRYRFLDHREHLDALLTTVGADREVVIVGHDWGGVLGIDWARRHPDAVHGIAYMETLVAPVSWNSENAPDPDLFRPLRTDAGDRWSCTTDPPGPTANRWHRQRREVAGLLTDLEVSAAGPRSADRGQGPPRIPS